jgi:pimeloyl-ACP methyl ester carboxylesterase
VAVVEGGWLRKTLVDFANPWDVSAIMDSDQRANALEIPTRQRGVFNSEDGTPIYFEVSGQGRPLIFCYGLVCRRDHWRHQLKYFYPDYTVITFDYRGHHRSGTPKNDTHLTLRWCSRDVKSLIAHLKLEEAVVLGHSMGVAVAAGAAEIAPDKIKGIVLICGSVSNPFQGMFYTDRMDRFYRISSKAYEWAPDAVAVAWKKLTEFNRLSFFLTSRLGFNPYLAEEQDVLRYMEGVNQTPPKTFFSLLKDYTSFDGRSQLKKIKCPALVIAGADDVITPVYLQEEMGQLIPRAVVEKIPLGSHNAHTDLPDMVNHKIETFLEHLGY